MAEIKQKQPQSVVLENREVLTVSGITDLVGFNENEILFTVGDTMLTVTGEGLTVTKLVIEKGEAIVCGKVDALIYTQNQMKKTLFSRLFK